MSDVAADRSSNIRLPYNNTEPGALTLAPEPGRVTETRTSAEDNTPADTNEDSIELMHLSQCNYYQSGDAVQVQTVRTARRTQVKENRQQYAPVL